MARGKPWTPDEDAKLGTATDAEVAKLLGRTARAVALRRSRLSIEAGTLRGTARKWSVSELRLLGTLPDGQLAKKLGVTRQCVHAARQAFQVAPYRP